MAVNVNIPANLTRFFEITFKDEAFRKFLVDLLTRIDTLEEKVTAQEAKITELMNNGN